MSDPVATPMTHVAIRTSDLQASVAFYRKYAALHIVHERVDHDVSVAWLSDRAEDPVFVIVLLQLPHERPIDPCATDHLGFAVRSREDIDRIAKLGREDGSHKYGPAEGGPVVGYFVMLRDPSGVTCEFSYGQPINPRDLKS